MAYDHLTAQERVADHRTRIGWKKSMDDCYEDLMDRGLSAPLRQEMERVSRGRHKNPLWRELQKGMVMSHDVKTIVNGLKKVKDPEVCDRFLVDPILDRVPPVMTPLMQWGLDREEEALRQYWTETWSHCQVPTQMGRPGILVSRLNPLVGTSPHAIVYAGHDHSRPKAVCAVIVKCFHPSQATHPKEVEQAVCLESKKGKLRLDREHAWYYEAQATIWAMMNEENNETIKDSVKRCDVVIYTVKGISVKRVRLNKPFICEMNDRVDDFINGHMYSWLWYHYETDSESSSEEP